MSSSHYSSSLEENILKAVMGKGFPEGMPRPNFVNEIIEAFKEDGWVKIPNVEIVTRYERGRKAEVIMVNGKGVMTGEEWLYRLENELNGVIDNWNPFQQTLGVKDFREAARRASGAK